MCFGSHSLNISSLTLEQPTPLHLSQMYSGRQTWLVGKTPLIFLFPEWLRRVCLIHSFRHRLQTYTELRLLSLSPKNTLMAVTVFGSVVKNH